MPTMHFESKRIAIVLILIAFWSTVLSMLVSKPIDATQQSLNAATNIVQSGRPSIIVLPDNNIIFTITTYHIIITTSKTGPIGQIEMEFPSSFNITDATLIEASIVPGTLSKSNQKLLYSITSAKNIASGTIIRLEIGGINNGNVQKNQLTVTIRDPANKTIEGPISSRAFTLTAVGSGMIYGGSLTSSKMSESFLKFGRLASGTLGWNPDGTLKIFTILDRAVNSTSVIMTSVNVGIGDSSSGSSCLADVVYAGKFIVSCNHAPDKGSSLNYLVITKR